MTDRVLTEIQVGHIEESIKNAKVYIPGKELSLQLVASHRLLQKRVRGLEERFIAARQIFQRYSVPLDKEIVAMVDRDFWELL